MGEEGVTVFQPSGTVKVNAPTLTDAMGFSAGKAAAASKKKRPTVNAVLMDLTCVKAWGSARGSHRKARARPGLLSKASCSVRRRCLFAARERGLHRRSRPG